MALGYPWVYNYGVGVMNLALAVDPTGTLGSELLILCMAITLVAALCFGWYLGIYIKRKILLLLFGRNKRR
jgi:hypothetical protein